jgi:serine phosphatase RsbU (regulator of sigma subunit)
MLQGGKPPESSLSRQEKGA